jgi:signal transduction histidine kinase
LKQSFQVSNVLLAGLTLLHKGVVARLLLPLAAILLPLSLALSAETAPVLLTNTAQVFSLPQPQVEDGKTPVRIRGIVTYYEPGVLLFVQDATAGVFVYYSGAPLRVQAGQNLEVTGVVAPGLYSPIISSPKFQPLESGSSILPRPVSLAEIDLGGLDAQWVEFTGVVRGLTPLPDRLGLELAVPPHRITVWVTQREGYERTHLVGSYVRVRGVVAGSYDNRRLAAFRVCANKLSDVTILQEATENPFAEPLLSIRELRGRQARSLIPGRVRTKGIVTLCWRDRVLFIQDSNAGLEVQSMESVGDLRPGDAVEVVGFPGPVLGSPTLEDALIRKVATGPVPKAVHISTEDLCHGDYCQELVEIEAELLGLTGSSSNLWSFALQSRYHHLTAILPGNGPGREYPAFLPGSQLRLTGVCVRGLALDGADPGACLLLRSPDGIVVASGPRTLSSHTMTVATILAALSTVGLLLAVGIIVKLRRRKAHMLETQSSLEVEMHQSEQQLRRSMEERERMGRDLHDDVIQSIYAVGLNLENCRRVVRDAPELAEARLTSAIDILNNSIRHVRGFLSGLEPKVLNGHEFKTALKSLALTNGDGPTQFQLQVDSSAANRLTPAQATQLLHIAKEAMSNSLRHAHASTLLVSLLPTNTSLRLEVSDNGDGFNPEALQATGHGLRNMTARAREIGADLQIVSARGQGCRVLVSVPQPDANGHG